MLKELFEKVANGFQFLIGKVQPLNYNSVESIAQRVSIPHR